MSGDLDTRLAAYDALAVTAGFGRDVLESRVKALVAQCKALEAELAKRDVQDGYVWPDAFNAVAVPIAQHPMLVGPCGPPPREDAAGANGPAGPLETALPFDDEDMALARG
jgi:hypothetical protein